MNEFGDKNLRFSNSELLAQLATLFASFLMIISSYFVGEQAALFFILALLIFTIWNRLNNFYSLSMLWGISFAISTIIFITGLNGIPRGSSIPETIGPLLGNDLSLDSMLFILFVVGFLGTLIYFYEKNKSSDKGWLVNLLLMSLYPLWYFLGFKLSV